MRAMRIGRYRRAGGEGIPKLRRRQSCGRGFKVDDQTLYFEITYFSISLINGARLSQTEARGLKNDAITVF